MAKIAIDTTVLEIVEREFPEACKFCLKENCSGCPFREERLSLQAALLLEEEPTVEKYENS
jgi:hypothetical protein